MKIWRILIMLVSVLCFTGASCAAEVLRVGIVPPAPGYIEQDAEGFYHGANPDYMQALASYAGYTVEFVPGNMNDLQVWLNDGRVDVIAGLVKTAERETMIDFSRLPMGWEYSFLYMSDDWTDKIGQSLKIGFTQSLYRSARLEYIAGRENLLFNPYFYRSIPDMYDAYTNKELDGVVISSLVRFDSPVAAAFDANTLHFGVKKGNTEILQRLNWAADQMMINDPKLIGRLYSRYRLVGDATPLALDVDERNYLKEKKVLRIVLPTGEKPYSYWENDKACGILPQLAAKMAADLGITPEFIPAPGNDAGFDLVQSGQADIMFNFYSDYGWAQRNHLLITAPYLTSVYTKVAKRGTDLPKHPRVASIKDKYLTQVYMNSREDSHQYIPCNTVDECLKAVQSGEADYALVREVTAQYNLLQGDYPDLVNRDGMAFSHDISMAVGPSGGSMLLRILDKEINHLGDDTAREMIRSTLAGVENSRSLRSLFYTYPVHFLIGISISGFLVTVLVMRLFFMRRSHERQLEAVMLSDAETGLPNRYWLEQEIWRILKQRRSNNKVSHDSLLLNTDDERGKNAKPNYIAVFQLPRMDVLIDAYGRKWVTQVIKTVAERLAAEKAWVEAVAVRTAGGQILAFLRDIDADILRGMIERFLATNEFIAVGELNAKVPFQVGIAPISDGDSTPQAFDNADLAAHESGGVKFFDAELKAQKKLQYSIESCMEDALAADEFKVWYQPKYDIRTQKCIGAEALVRWESSKLGFLMPGKFIDLFEKNGFVTKLDFYILERVFKFQREQREHNAPVVPISVNQSRLHIRERDYVDKIRSLAEKYGDTESVELELTETAFDMGLQQRESAMTVVRSLKQTGFSISMDDFGTGYSDISLLNVLPMDVMKLDRSLLTASEGSERMQIVLTQVIEMGKKLGMDVICEGIETKEQEEMLLSCGCEKGQGFLYAKPMSEERFREFLQTHV